MKISKYILIALFFFFAVSIQEAGAFATKTREEEAGIKKEFIRELKRNGRVYLCFYRYNEKMTKWTFVYTGKYSRIYDTWCIEK